MKHRPLTPDGMAVWDVIQGCSGQVRATFGSVYGLDFTAVLMLAGAMGVSSPMLAEMLPLVEPLLIDAYRAEGDHDD